jgi:hypothetical protein
MARKIDSRKMLDRAIQYWKIYCIINEHNKTIFQIWDGLHLKCTFRRCVDLRIFNLWDEVVSLAAAITLFNDEDSMIWRTVPVIRGLLISIPIWGIGVINFRGVVPVYIPTVWKLIVSLGFISFCDCCPTINY